MTITLAVRIHRTHDFSLLLPVSYALPGVGSNATWYENACTFVNQSVIGSKALGLFIDHHDQIYTIAESRSQILVWQQGNTNPIRSLQVRTYEFTALFVTVNGDVYFDNGNERGRIDAWPISSNRHVFVTKFSDNCHGLFVDINNTLYCSMQDAHRVEKISLNNLNERPIAVSGTGCRGIAQNELHEPWGIFVDTEFDLYVADAKNNRIQLFRPGQLNGITVAGNGTPGDLQLNFPTGVVADRNDYLYIADNRHDRVIRVKGGEYQCIVGCSGKSGSTANALQKAYAVQLDSRGDLYVADEENDRIQKFQLISRDGGKSDGTSVSEISGYISFFLSFSIQSLKPIFTSILESRLMKGK